MSFFANKCRVLTVSSFITHRTAVSSILVLFCCDFFAYIFLDSNRVHVWTRRHIKCIFFCVVFVSFPIANIVLSSCCKQNVRTGFIRCECNSTVQKYTSNWIEIDTNRKSIETGHFEHVSIAVHFYKCQFNCNRPRKQCMYPVRYHEVFKYLPANEQARENVANEWKKKTRTKTKIWGKKIEFQHPRP